jgi:hypothetical protein
MPLKSEFSKFISLNSLLSGTATFKGLDDDDDDDDVVLGLFDFDRAGEDCTIFGFGTF